MLTVWVACLSLAGVAAAGARVEGTLDITFTGRSTLHDFEGGSPAVPFIASSEAGDQESWLIELAVPVASLSTGNEMRDRKMRQMFDADSHPDIVAKLHRVRVDELRGNADVPGAIDFALTIGNVTRHLRATLSEWRQETDDAVSFSAEFAVSLNDFDLQPPSVLFIEVADAVAVRVHVRAQRRDMGALSTSRVAGPLPASHFDTPVHQE